MGFDVPTYKDIVEARERISGFAARTPLLSSPQMDQLTGGRIFFKAENLQRTGSFKFRGAFNKMSLIPLSDREKGVVAVSSGNHAQGVAEAGRLLNIPVSVVMPEDAPPIKLERVRERGAEIVLYNRDTENREAIALDLAERKGATFVAPYDDPMIIAGQGTAGAEIAEDMRALNSIPDAVLVCCGGGGLTAGICLGVHETMPETDIYMVEPKGFDDTARSLEKGERMRNASMSGSLCDALLTPMPGEITFTINSHHVAGGISVSDEDVLKAMAFAFRELKLVVEPGGAVCLAALLSGAFQAKGKTVVALLSGGNVAPEIMMRALSA